MRDLNDKINDGGATAAGKLSNINWNEVASELQNLIEKYGITLDATGVDLAQAALAVSMAASGKGFWCTDSGSSTAYVLAPSFTSISNPLYTGLTIKFRPANNSSVIAPTVNYNGTGVKTIKNEAGDSLVVGDLSTLRDAEIRYDGTDFRLLTRSTNLLLASMYRKGYIQGFYMLNGTSNATYGVLVAAGDCANSDASLNLITATPIEKRIDQVWASGTNAGGRPPAVAHNNNAWYRVFVIGGASVTTEIGFDTAANASNLLSAATAAVGGTYNKYRQIGWVLTDGAGAIVKFYMDSNDYSVVMWQTPVENVNANNPPATRVTAAVTAPPDAAVLLSVWASDSAAPDFHMDVRPVVMTDVAASASNNVIRAGNVGSGETSNSIALTVLVNSSSQIAYRFAGTLSNSLEFKIASRGFKYTRGIQ